METTPGQSWALEIRSGRGRCAVGGARGLKAGDVVMSTPPYSAMCMPSRFGSLCNCCFRGSAGAGKKLKRCSKCKTISYCSKECQQKDWECHKKECKHLPVLMREMLSAGAEDQLATVLLAARCLWKAQRTNAAVEVEHGAQTTAAGDRGTNVSDLDALASLSLNASLDPETCPEAMRILATILTGHATGDKPLCPPGTDLGVAARLLARFEQNNFGILDDLQVCVGAGVFPRGALLNHSCSPNCVLVYRPGVGGTCVQEIRCIRDVRPGEELCHSYTDLCAPTSSRQEKLRSIYGFTCTCARCLTPLKTPFPPLGLHPHSDADGQLEQSDVDVDACLTGRASASGQSKKARSVSLSPERVARELQEASNLHDRAMAADDVQEELELLKRALVLQETHLHSLNLQLYVTRGLLMSTCLVAGDLDGARAQCVKVVDFLATTLSHVQYHPLLALQLYTLADLEAAQGLRAASVHHMKKCVEILGVTHGVTSPLYQSAIAKLETDTGALLCGK